VALHRQVITVITVITLITVITVIYVTKGTEARAKTRTTHLQPSVVCSPAFLRWAISEVHAGGLGHGGDGAGGAGTSRGSSGGDCGGAKEPVRGEPDWTEFLDNRGEVEVD